MHATLTAVRSNCSLLVLGFIAARVFGQGGMELGLEIGILGILTIDHVVEMCIFLKF